MGSDSIPQNSFGWEYKPRSSLCTHTFHHTDSKDLDIYVLDGRVSTSNENPACKIHEDGMWLSQWLDWKTVTYAKISPEMVNPRDIAGEWRTTEEVYAMLRLHTATLNRDCVQWIVNTLFLTNEHWGCGLQSCSKQDSGLPLNCTEVKLYHHTFCKCNKQTTHILWLFCQQLSFCEMFCVHSITDGCQCLTNLCLLELTWVLTPFPITILDESINKGLVCAHMHSIAQTQKILTFMSNAPSTKTQCDNHSWVKKWSRMQRSHQKWWTQEIQLVVQKKKK